MTIDISQLYKYPIIEARELQYTTGTIENDVCVWANPNEPVIEAKGWYVCKLDKALLDRNNQLFIDFEPIGWNAVTKVEDYINNNYKAKVINSNKEPYYCSDVSELEMLKDWEKVYDSVS